MAEDFYIAIGGLEALNTLDDLPRHIIEAARIAVNEAATWGRTRLAEGVLAETNFPKSYVQPAGKRLWVKQRATNATLEAVIGAKTRRTSLARFAASGTPTGGARRGGVNVTVNPGENQTMKGAFLVRLNQDDGSDSVSKNIGLAVRTKNGRPPPGYRPARLSENVWLLYGPSVAQNLYSDANQGGVVTEKAPDIVERLRHEYERQLARLTK